MCARTPVATYELRASVICKKIVHKNIHVETVNAWYMCEACTRAYVKYQNMHCNGAVTWKKGDPVNMLIHSFSTLSVAKIWLEFEFIHWKFLIVIFVMVLVDFWFKELNPRQRVYVEIPKPSRVELKYMYSQNPRC
jgi:hypothetical protein